MNILEEFEKSLDNLSVETLRDLAFHDALTGTYNRNALERYREELDKKELSITIGDVDDLKSVNDLFGHQAGDVFIRRSADALKKYSEMIFRLGGDEFLMVQFLFPPKQSMGVVDVIDRLAIEQMTFGTVNKSSDESLSSAMSRADKKMYEAKGGKKIGRDQ